MSGATIEVGGAERVAAPAAGRRLRARHLWLIPGLAIALFANEVGKAHGVGILLLIAFGIAPDLPRLLGIGRRRDHSIGSLVIRAFNVLHHPAAALAAVVVTATGIVPAVWLVGALVWLGHIVIGLGVGDVRRPPAGRRSGG